MKKIIYLLILSLIIGCSDKSKTIDSYLGFDIEKDAIDSFLNSKMNLHNINGISLALINKGKVVLKGKPLELIDSLKGKVYQKTILRTELAHYKKQYTVINDKLFLGKPVIQVYSETPLGNGFELIDAGLEEVYFSQINEY